jgi:hypothetical protein
MSTTHVCQRCGHEDDCGYGSWPDRHPILATVGGLFGLTFMGMMFSVYPGGAWTMTTLAAVVVGVRALGRARRRRAALATRAEWEHSALMAQSAGGPTIRRQPQQHGPWHVMTHWPTTPMQTAQIRARK